MTGGRTVWRAKDAAWWRREWIVALGEEFGPAGPAVIDWLEGEAKAQNDGGFVKAGPRSISRGCFVDAVTVGHVLSRSVTLGLLVDYEESAGRFTCRISWWKADQEKALATSRKAKQRAQENGGPVEPDDLPPLSRPVTVSHGKSRPVTECPPTGQNRTEPSTTSKNSNVELRSAVVECFAYWQERCGHAQSLLSADRRGKLEARVRERAKLHGSMSAAVDDVRKAIDGAALHAFVDEKGKRFDDIELICRNGSKLEDFMGRADLPPQGIARVLFDVPINRKPNASELLRAINSSDEIGGAA